MEELTATKVNRNAKKRASRLRSKKAAVKDATKESALPVQDPLSLLKAQLATAKSSGDHVLARKLRQDLWVLQDVNAGHRPELKTDDYEESLGRIAAVNALKATEVKSIAVLSPVEKDIRKLEKKLAQIEKLKEMHRQGETLEKTQVDKIKSESKVQDELRGLHELLANMKVSR